MNLVLRPALPGTRTGGVPFALGFLLDMAYGLVWAPSWSSAAVACDTCCACQFGPVRAHMSQCSV
jgi:hypothetical protein